MDALFVFPAASAKLIMERRMEVIANNIANVSTTGFRKDFPVFGSVTAELSAANSLGGSQDATGGISQVPIPSFIIVDRMLTNFTEGPLNTTGSPLDMAIDGPGFFQIQTPRGIRYTRSGSFTISNEGVIVTPNGNPVLGEGGPMTLPPGIVNVDGAGRVSVRELDGLTSTAVGTIALVEVEDLTQLQKEGNNLFQLIGSTARPLPEGQSLVRQGTLEGSNVNPVEEMIAMISAIRQYESSQKAIQTAEDMDLKSINKIGQLEA